MPIEHTTKAAFEIRQTLNMHHGGGCQLNIIWRNKGFWQCRFDRVMDLTWNDQASTALPLAG
ncbi:hypothetical protein KK137_00900 [Croceibacterium sp. LX-88]|jgi:hypothetical protein|uniref:Uncharacterized protein n=1 Tax=Croceibacterium selenioxidans TaxID=2838833 RepID=A0ABS5W3B3_9SPHN|nr:hypothetical protein [Croceibacterium selenioxidans]MBT2132879.1 hypothetical protein [Croceibacterium selenioxidans]